ncbi:MAG TPA: tetratricopeptide repeat protein [Acidiferrobacterales bacterium]
MDGPRRGPGAGTPALTRRATGRTVDRAGRFLPGAPRAGREATIKPILVALSGLLASGCSLFPATTAIDPRRVDALFADSLFAAPAEPVRADDLFALSQPMREFATTRIVQKMGDRGQYAGLFEALRDELHLDYDSARTRPAAETFAARSGNCLSLVILAAAYAKEFGIRFGYQDIRTDGAWSRSADIAFYSGHVNLLLGHRWHDDWRLPERSLIIDFLAPGAAGRLVTHGITEDTVVAMYLNNRAAETLLEGDLDGAYWWARAAVVADPSFTGAYNTLAVIYRRHGNLAEAERTLRWALTREPVNPRTLSNLAVVLESQGRRTEADAVRARLASIEPYPPFHFLDAGLAASARGDHDAAIALFRRELQRMPYADELHFAIAVAELDRGRLRHARRHLGLALEKSTTRDRRGIYAAKLNYLESLRTN